MNQQRESRGLPALRESSRLNRSAQGWTRTMVDTRQFDHGANFSARISAVGVDWAAAGENIAVGYKTPSQVVDGWMASDGHCQNILEPLFTQVGTGVMDRGIGSWGSGATWTDDFALPMYTPAPSKNDGPMDGCPYNV